MNFQQRKLGILGRKVGMTRIFDEKGVAIGVTVLELGPCVVLQKRSAVEGAKTDGYTALQLGFDPKPEKKLTKAIERHVVALTVEMTDGNQSRAASLLNTSTSSVCRKVNS